MKIDDSICPILTNASGITESEDGVRNMNDVHCAPMAGDPVAPWDEEECRTCDNCARWHKIGLSDYGVCEAMVDMRPMRSLDELPGLCDEIAEEWATDSGYGCEEWEEA